MPHAHRPRPLTAVAARACVICALVAVPGGLAVAGSATAAPEHHYGAVPFRATQRSTGSAAPRAFSTSPVLNSALSLENTVAFGGDIAPGDNAGVGVITGPHKVYLVFWGSQWGAQTHGATVQGKGDYDTFSGDPDSVAPDLQAFFSGLGTGIDGWSGVFTQYCQSSADVTVAFGASACPAGATHTAYPTGGVLAGVWYDNTTAVLAGTTPATEESATAIAEEAEAAATQFGNTTQASNENVEYVIVSPPNTHPDGFNTGIPDDDFCGWHDDSADTATVGDLPQTNGTVFFTNMPYVPDAGTNCGADSVNPGSSPGLDDGVTIVVGHEYSEWLTDPYPGAGWYNPLTGDEIADECAWITSGQGAMTDIPLATGSFPVQSLWSNFNGACETSSLTLDVMPSTQADAAGTSVTSLRVTASDAAASQTLTYSASGLPAGLAIDRSTGAIDGHISGAPGGYDPRITVTDTNGAHATKAIVLTVLDDVVLTRPRTQATPARRTVRFRIEARDRITYRTLHYAARGLPEGLTINAHTGVISGTTSRTRRAYVVSVVVTDSAGARADARFTWKVT